MKTLKQARDGAMDATAVILDCEDDIRDAKVADRVHDACLERVAERLHASGDRESLALVQSAMNADEAEDAKLYGRHALEYRLIRGRSIVVGITRIAENAVRLGRAVATRGDAA